MLAVFGYGALFAAFTMGVLYLFQERELLARSPRRFYYLIPSLERSDTIGGRSVAGGFGFLTLAIATGFLWNHSLHGRYWTGDPKEWAALVAWGIYVAILVARWRWGWGGRRAAWLAGRRVHGRGVHVRLGDARAGGVGGGAMIVVVGLNHETAPVAVREALAFPKERLAAALARVRKDAGLDEAMILSTCNRVEVYGCSEKPGSHAAQGVAEFLARYHGQRARADREAPVPARGRAGGAPRLPGGGQPRLDGARRVADPGAGEGGLPGGRAGAEPGRRAERPAHALDLRRQARAHGDRDRQERGLRLARRGRARDARSSATSAAARCCWWAPAR